MSNGEGGHFHECPSCHLEYQCDFDAWPQYCLWYELSPNGQRCMDCEADDVS
mgnify:FL=1